MKRIPEPELMDDAEQARAYAQADFSEPHQAFIEHFRERLADHVPRHVVDLGCGPADITIRFARAFPHCRITGVDAADAMLALARDAVGAAGLTSRIELRKVRLPAGAPRTGGFDTLISNSLLHHLADAQVLWQTLKDAGTEGAAVFVMDRLRPESVARATELVKEYCGDEPEVLRRDFFHSLLAAYRPDEVGAQIEAAGLGTCLQLEVVSDRHFVVWGHLS
jgi:trans-aconitate methyltransferase